MNTDSNRQTVEFEQEEIEGMEIPWSLCPLFSPIPPGKSSGAWSAKFLIRAYPRNPRAKS
jgi:hypothetical protein